MVNEIKPDHIEEDWKYREWYDVEWGRKNICKAIDEIVTCRYYIHQSSKNNEPYESTRTIAVTFCILLDKKVLKEWNLYNPTGMNFPQEFRKIMNRNDVENLVRTELGENWKDSAKFLWVCLGACTVDFDLPNSDDETGSYPNTVDLHSSDDETGGYVPNGYEDGDCSGR